MKKWTTLWIMIMMLGVSVPALGAMSISKMRQNTRFLTDRMAYELKLSPQQYDDVYEVNYDFINNVRYLMDDVVRGYDYALERYYDFLDVRNDDLRWILSGSQYRRFLKAEYFYRPIYAQNNKWQFRIYMVYNNVNFFYFGKPHHYASYCGGHYRTHFNNVSYYRTHFHNRYHPDIYDGHYRIRHDRVTYDNHRRRDFQVNVRPPKKDNHRPATPQARPGRRPGRDNNHKHEERPPRREYNSRPDKDRRENRRSVSPKRDSKKENKRNDKNSNQSGGRSATHARTV